MGGGELEVLDPSGRVYGIIPLCKSISPYCSEAVKSKIFYSWRLF
jgi:hypothetical protein